MGFKEWLNEEVDVASALKDKAEKGMSIKTKFGTFKFDKMDKKKYVFILDGKDKDIKVEVVAKPNDRYLDLTVTVLKGEEIVGKKKSEKDDSDVHYEKTDITRKATKDIKKAIEGVLGSLNEDEILQLDEDMGLTALAGAMAPLVVMAVPALYKSAVENGWFGLGSEKDSKITKPEDIAERMKKFSLKKTQELLKDESQVDEIVDEIIDAIKKNSPRFIVNPRTKGELYNKVLYYLRRNAEAKASEPAAKAMGSVRDAAKEALAKSSGYKKGGVWFGNQT